MCLDDGTELDGQHASLPRSADDGVSAEYRRQLLLLNRERIEFSYEKACRQGLEDAIILVLDLSDNRAACMSRMTGVSWEQIEQSRQECDRLGVVPVQVISIPRSAAMCIVGPSTPRSPLGVARPTPPDMFRVIAIAAGGNSFADFPLPPVTELEGG